MVVARYIIPFFIFVYKINTTTNDKNNTTDVFAKVLNELEVLKNNKKNKKIIEICNEILSKETLDTNVNCKILEILGEAYLESGNNKKSIETYKILINNYQNLYDKNNVLYKICVSIYNLMPKRPEVDLKYCKEMISYGRYAINNITNNDLKEKIDLMIEEAYSLVEDKEINDIKFFFDNKKYDSTLYLIDIFLKEFKDTQYYDHIMNIKNFSHFYLIKKTLELIKNIKNKNTGLEPYKKLYNEIYDNYQELEKLVDDPNISEKTKNSIKKNIDKILLYIGSKF